MNKAKLVDRFYGKCNLSHVEARNILSKYLILDEHSHQVATRQKLHEHVEEGIVLESGV